MIALSSSLRGIEMDIMSPEDVEERTSACPTSTFDDLICRKRPLVLRGAALAWPGRDFLESAGVRDLRVTWRVHPQGERSIWEADCRFLDASVGEFMEWNRFAVPLAGSSSPFAPFDRRTHWAYADYKHVKELADDWATVLEPMVDWSSLGCGKTVADSTVWLGTEGSHTPLHHDTYGVNLVSQLHGKKKWLLYCPEDTSRLYPTRVPYEESSVFSLIDARVPDLNRFPRLAEARPVAVTLEPGDVLYVPKHWWHFVEALDTSLSVNVWVDTPDDSQDRAKEALARVFITSLASGLEAEVGPGWLNPTEEGVWPLEETLQVADLAFQGLNPAPGNATSVDGNKYAFSVRALVDAITAPDILSEVMERVLMKTKKDEPTRDTLPPVP